MNDIKDIKPPINLPFHLIEDLWWLWVLLLLMAIVGGIYFFFLNKKIKKKEPVLPPLPAWQIAINRLDLLAVKNLPANGFWRQYYGELSDILRHYIEGHFSLKAPEMTSEEFLNSLKYNQHIKEEHKALLRDFLNTCDMVKFAKHASNPEEARNSFELVLRFINETKDSMRTP